jgi:hypothetical protein
MLNLVYINHQKMKKITTILLLAFFHISFAQNTNCKCCTKEHKAFDFWVGKWQVTKPDGSPAGTNTISKIEDNCILQEKWTSATPGYTGSSYNFYNPNTKQWEQVWMDNQGQPLYLKGNRKDNQMILWSDATTNTQGQQYYNRVTWTLNKDGSVRQHWETTADKKNFTTVFDGLYTKIN